MSDPNTRTGSETTLSRAPTVGFSRRRRPQEFLLPDGRKILVALPEEAQRMRDKYAHHASDPNAVQVEVVIHGSSEHSQYLQHMKKHHEDLFEALRLKHGADFDTWLESRDQLDIVSREIEGLTDHSETLNSNFEKYGYNSILRTFNDSDRGGRSRTGSVMGDGDSDDTSTMSKWESRTVDSFTRLYQRPVIKQYFHRGLLWRAEGETQIMSFELFFDLIYVGILAINGDHAAEEANGSELLRFIVTFLMSSRIWSDVQQAVSWFATDDVVQRLQILFLIALLLGFTTNMLQAFDPEHDTYAQLTGFYVAARLFTAAYYGVTLALLPLIKGVMLCHILIVLIPSALWIASIFVPMPARLGLIWVALVLDLWGSIFVTLLYRYSRNRDTPFAKRVNGFFDFFPAINIEHKVERTNAFVSLVIGYGIVGILFQNSGTYGVNAFLGKAVLGLVQAYIFNWIYFDVDAANLHTHAIRRHANTAFLWLFGHLPFICAYVLSAAAMSKLVVATDYAGLDAHELTELYEERADEHVSLGIRLYYCVGLGVALFSMGLINVSHEHKIPANCHMPKWARLLNRAAVCAVFCALPAAQELRSVELIGITVSLMVWVLVFELWGAATPETDFMGRKGGCTYNAKCGRKQLEKALKDDGEVDVVELGKDEKTAVDI